MSVAASNTSIEAVKETKLKVFIKFAWPILANFIGLNCLFPFIRFWNHNAAVLQYALTPGLILLLAVEVKKRSYHYSFSIFIALIYTFYNIYQAITWTIEQLLTLKSISFLLACKWYYLIIFLSIVEFICAIHYLLNNCNYKELFAIHKINFNINIHVRLFVLIKKLLKFITKLLQKTLNFKIILYFWFIPIMYVFWFKKYFFLLPNATLGQFVNYIQVLAIPLGISCSAVFLYKLCNLLNKFGVALYSLTSIGVGIYGIIQYYNYYYNFPITIQKQAPQETFRQIGNFLNNPNSWSCFLDALVCAIGMGILVKFVFLCDKSLKRTINYGSATFLDLNGIKKLNSKDGLPIGEIPKITDFNDLPKIINNIKNHGGDQLIKIKTHHTTLIAPSRAGKGAGIIIPTLLDYPGPVFVTDIKGENYYVTARGRKERGRQVYAFDPFNLTKARSVTINPLDFLINTGDLVTNSQIFTDLLCPIDARASAEARHFQEQAGLVLQCLCLYVIEEPTISIKTLGTVHDLLCEKDPMALFANIAENYTSKHEVITKLATRILGIHYRELSSIITTAYSCIKFANTPEIRKSTHSSSISLSDITKVKFDLFVCIPPKLLATQQRLLRLITGIIFANIQDAQGDIGKHNILMLLDETPALGYMKQIEQILSFGAGYGVNLLVVSQTIGFLKNCYPDTWDSFFSNQLSIFFGCNDPMTAEFITKKIGKFTIETTAISEGIGKQNSRAYLGNTSIQTSNSKSETGRDVLMPDEIQRLGNNVVLAFNAGEKPILCSRINYWQREEWAGSWDLNPFHENRKLKKPQYTLKEYIKLVWQILTS